MDFLIKWLRPLIDALAVAVADELESRGLVLCPVDDDAEGELQAAQASSASAPAVGKREFFSRLYDAGHSVFIHLDTRREGVVVPPYLRGQPQLVLQVGLNLAVKVPDMHVDADGLTCTLSFNRSPFWCAIPWSAVYALVSQGDQGGMVWREDIPPEVAAQMAEPSAKQAPASAKVPTGAGSGPRMKGKLRVIKGGLDAPPGGSGAA